KDKTTTLPIKLSGYVNYLAFSPDGRRVLTANGLSPYGPFGHGEERVQFADSREARVWNTATGKPITPPLQHESHADNATISPDGRRVVTASEDTRARVREEA